MARRYDSNSSKRRILSACVKLFLERGYTETRVADIVREADVTISTFQNIFHTKDGVLYELMQDMFSGQFATAERYSIGATTPAMVYAVETAIQLAIVELDLNVRNVYIEAYTNRETTEFINRQTARRMMTLFSRYLPDYTESDFYEMDVGSAGLMRAYMVRSCDMYFPLERKIERFLSMSLAAYQVPQDEIQAVIAFVQQMDIRAVARNVLEDLFAMLEMHFVIGPKPHADARAHAAADVT